ncbi:MAG: sugar ABC transporter ATP-binding protein, partial [Mesorhizobium sp.]|nr:sugar ABC transporter ATP-binding protein [Mesorhizobium sp.]
MTTNPLLDATGVAKNYGAVAALRNASLSVLPGEVHALMGANGAGKSTLVKILTGAINADAGRILIRGKQLDVRSPADARRAGLLPVYQEPSLIPDLDVLSNLRLTGTPIEPFRAWVRELGIPTLDIRDTARDIPLAILRVLDLARALAVEPDVLLLDEMTAALPANLAEKVLEVVRRQGDAGRSVIFISHRFVEISALCDRATVLRDGSTVGVVDIEPGIEERIVEMMLGTRIEKTRVASRSANDVGAVGGRHPRLSVRNLQLGTKLNDVSFDLANGEVVGVFALEGQGQDELFAALAGSIRPTGGTIQVDGAPVNFSHPSDAIQAGIAYVPGDRTEALA